MNKVVLDASALLALLYKEPGWEQLTPELLGCASMGAANLAEVQTKLVAQGLEPDEAWEYTLSLVYDPVAFTPEQAKLAGALLPKTRALGLSLGDRACLALGLLLDAPVYTADKSWKALKVGVRIHVIR
jgi:ribonuclease VapC